jgi:Raf kinase inhibitor-like YbhB/YbcL family protein
VREFRLSSSAFQQGYVIPRQFTGEGDDISPALMWTTPPDGTRELALVVDDPDAPTDEPWVHWVLYRLSPHVTNLPERVAPALRSGPDGAVQGTNSWPKGIGYRGPMPPKGHGVHHYHFRLYALDRELSLEPGLDKMSLLAAMEGHILGVAELIGTYER